MNYLAVIIGGGLGSLLRFLISEWLVIDNAKWPWSTFVTNILASLLLGLLIGYFLRSATDTPWKMFWLIGFCGGFSTFSTFAKETFNLYQSGQSGMAFLYVLLSSILGVCMIFAGMKIMSPAT